jgi:hypothetical protein
VRVRSESLVVEVLTHTQKAWRRMTMADVRRDTPNDVVLAQAAHPWVLPALAALGGLLGGLAVKQFRSRVASTGDEPPVRVRNGSLRLEVLDEEDEWEQATDRSGKPTKTWKLAHGRKRAGERLQIVMSLRQHTTCEPRVAVVQSSQLDVEYNDRTVIRITAQGRRLNVTPPVGLTLTHDPNDSKCLTYAGKPGGYIQALRTPDGQLNCTFKGKSELRGVYIFDW